jgi:GNAT superfamily N-acetyltransferase
VAVLADNLTILPIPPDFQPGGFSCGEAEVDAYLTESALRDELAGVTRTSLVRDGDALVAFVSVLFDSIELDPGERPVPHPTAPALKLGAMGVRTDYEKRDFQGRTLGVWLLDWVVGLAWTLGAQAGLRYVTLDSLPKEKLVNWYSAYGFKKNIGETQSRQILKHARAKSRRVRDKKVEEMVLPTVSMRYDIRLRPEA